ncbi:hypothetical protein ACMT9Y_08560 [Clavibacter tessellarius]|uniref:hypothetical protein n=1 Tax=Clavibacter tessellarius TaxID=31965 RepID=UPI0039E9D9CE
MLTRLAKETRSPAGAIGGGIFFLAFGLIAAIQTLADPGRVGYRGTPFAVLAAGMLICGVLMLLGGLKARSMRARDARDAAREASADDDPAQHDGGAPGGAPPS